MTVDAGPRARYALVDGLRAFAAMWVVVFHAYAGRHIDHLAPHLPDFLVTFLSLGDRGVTIFFVLSGFVIAHSLAKSDVDAGFMGRFALRRSLRLDPPYWVSILVALCALAVKARTEPGTHFPGAGEIASHLFYLQGLLRLPQINPIYWTLCLEFQLYLVFCFLMFIAARLPFRSGRLWVVIPALAFADAYPVGLLHWAPPGLFLPFWHLFLAGAMVRLASPPGRRRWSTLETLAAANSLFLLAVGVVNRDSGALIAGIASGTLLVASVLARLETWLNWRPLQAIGMWSFSLYLFHNQVTGAAFRIAYRLTGRSALSEAFWFLAIAALNVGVAALMFRLVEQPSLRLSHLVQLHPGPARGKPSQARPSKGCLPAVTDEPQARHVRRGSL